MIPLAIAIFESMDGLLKDGKVTSGQIIVGLAVVIYLMWRQNTKQSNYYRKLEKERLAQEEKTKQERAAKELKDEEEKKAIEKERFQFFVKQAEDREKAEKQRAEWYMAQLKTVSLELEEIKGKLVNLEKIHGQTLADRDLIKQIADQDKEKLEQIADLASRSDCVDSAILTAITKLSR